MNRRGFLGFFGGAVAAGPTAARSLASETVLKQAGFASGSGLVGAATSQTVDYAPAGAHKKAIRWIRRNGLPEWKMNELRQRAEHKRVNGVDPDLAVLRSVSPGWKAREQRRRNLEREIEFSLSTIGRGREREEYSKKLSDRFGGWFDWYD